MYTVSHNHLQERDGACIHARISKRKIASGICAKDDSKHKNSMCNLSLSYTFLLWGYTCYCCCLELSPILRHISFTLFLHINLGVIFQHLMKMIYSSRCRYDIRRTYYYYILHCNMRNVTTHFHTDTYYFWTTDINYPIHLARLSCSGSEYRVTDCQYNNNTEGFTYYNDWAVHCSVG